MIIFRPSTSLLREPADVLHIVRRYPWKSWNLCAASVAVCSRIKLFCGYRFDEWRRELKQRFDMEKPTICLCHAGMRSRRLAELLLEEGFQEVYNVVGGIDAYSLQIDRKVPRYWDFGQGMVIIAARSPFNGHVIIAAQSSASIHTKEFDCSPVYVVPVKNSRDTCVQSGDGQPRNFCARANSMFACRLTTVYRKLFSAYASRKSLKNTL